MKIFVTYLQKDDDELSHVALNIEFNVDTGSISVDRDLPPRLSLKVKELAVQLHSFYLDLEDGKEKKK